MDFCAWIGILKPNQCLNSPNTKTWTAMQNAEKQGGLGSSAMSPFRVHTTSYSTLIETASILYHLWDIPSHLPNVADFHQPHLHLVPSLGVIPFKFHQQVWHHNTRVTGLLCGILCAILHLTILTCGWQTQTRCDNIYHAIRAHNKMAKTFLKC